jgi:DNA-binding response OmpR family regulator
MLIVDDEESIGFALREYFTRLGYSVDFARDKDRAEELADGDPYSILLVDLQLTAGRNDGIDVVDCMRRVQPDIKVIMLTGYGSPEAEEAARQSGVDVFLEKPQPLPLLAQEVGTLLGGR